MTLDEARTCLQTAITEDGTLKNTTAYLYWDGSGGDEPVTLDGRFFLDELEAIVVYCRATLAAKDAACPPSCKT